MHRTVGSSHCTSGRIEPGDGCGLENRRRESARGAVAPFVPLVRGGLLRASLAKEGLQRCSEELQRLEARGVEPLAPPPLRARLEQQVERESSSRACKAGVFRGSPAGNGRHEGTRAQREPREQWRSRTERVEERGVEARGAPQQRCVLPDALTEHGLAKLRALAVVDAHLEGPLQPAARQYGLWVQICV